MSETVGTDEKRLAPWMRGLDDRTFFTMAADESATRFDYEECTRILRTLLLFVGDRALLKRFRNKRNRGRVARALPCLPSVPPPERFVPFSYRIRSTRRNRLRADHYRRAPNVSPSLVTTSGGNKKRVRRGRQRVREYRSIPRPRSF